MNYKKLLKSIGLLVAVGAIVAGGTVAFYNDTETSEGNIFTAGSIDLKVDHLKQTYNDVDCTTCDVEIVSDPSTMITERNETSVGPYNAEEVADPHNDWTATISGADWIWEKSSTDHPTDTQNTVSYTFERTFTWWGPISGATLDLAVAADNGYEVSLNGNPVGDDPSENNFTASEQDSYSGSAISNNIQQGLNTLTVVVTNQAPDDFEGTSESNPAGLLFRLHIDGNCEDDYFKSQCTLFGEKDLEQGDYFFQFDDIKPGDFGTNVISLHAYDNDAYACLIAHDGVDDENTVHESELPDDDTKGELQDYVNIFAWIDDGDGSYDPSDETSLGETTLANLATLASLENMNAGEYLTASTTSNIGLAWCAGDIQVNHNSGVISCDGNGMLNDAQSDSFASSLTAYAVQTRNNGDFTCSASLLEQGV